MRRRQIKNSSLNTLFDLHSQLTDAPWIRKEGKYRKKTTVNRFCPFLWKQCKRKWEGVWWARLEQLSPATSERKQSAELARTMSLKRMCKIPSWAGLLLFALLTVVSFVYCWNTMLPRSKRLLVRGEEQLAAIAGSVKSRVRKRIFLFNHYEYMRI